MVGNEFTLGPFTVVTACDTLVTKRLAHFWPALMVAHEVGLSHPEDGFRPRARRIVSEDSYRREPCRSFLLIVRTGRVVTAAKRRRVAPDTRSFQHIAEFYNYLG